MLLPLSPSTPLNGYIKTEYPRVEQKYMVTLGVRFCGIDFGNQIMWNQFFGSQITCNQFWESDSVELILGVRFCGISFRSQILWNQFWESDYVESVLGVRFCGISSRCFITSW